MYRFSFPKTEREEKLERVVAIWNKLFPPEFVIPAKTSLSDHCDGRIIIMEKSGEIIFAQFNLFILLSEHFLLLL